MLKLIQIYAAHKCDRNAFAIVSYANAHPMATALLDMEALAIFREAEARVVEVRAKTLEALVNAPAERLLRHYGC